VSQSIKNDFQPKIIGIVTSENLGQGEIWEKLADCNLVEFRGDFWKPAEVLSALKKFRKDCQNKLKKEMEILFTLRLKQDGGMWADEIANEREKIWLSMGLDKGHAVCEWLDLELNQIPTFSEAFQQTLKNRQVKILVSHHEFKGSFSSDELTQMGLDLSSTNFDGVKLAVNCKTREEVVSLLEFAKVTGLREKNACVLSMGNEGRATRVVGPILGCYWTYGYLLGKAVAPGQLSVQELKAFFAKARPQELKRNPELPDLLLWAEASLVQDSIKVEAIHKD